MLLLLSSPSLSRFALQASNNQETHCPTCTAPAPVDQVHELRFTEVPDTEENQNIVDQLTTGQTFS